jgi:hypothetical protein
MLNGFTAETANRITEISISLAVPYAFYSVSSADNQIAQMIGWIAKKILSNRFPLLIRGKVFVPAAAVPETFVPIKLAQMVLFFAEAMYICS